MQTAIDMLSNRLQALIGDVYFRSDYDRALDSPEHLLAIGEFNIREYAKIEAMDEERQERIQSLLSNVFAHVLQKEAIEKYGNTNNTSIRQVLYDWLNQPENQAYWDKFIKCAKQGLEDLNLTEEQCQGVMKLFDMLPVAMMETLEELTCPFRLLPRAEAQSIAIALSDIMKEESS